MKSNLHTHTYRCGHAIGKERDYVLAAIDAGLEMLGFSDHCPLPFPADYDSSSIRMAMSELPHYCEKVLALKDEFRTRIDIRLGFELEYYPAYFNAILDELKNYPVDYLIQGQHFIGNEIGEPYMGRPLGSDILKCYVDQTIEGMGTGQFLYLAHPDLPNFTGDENDYEREMRRLCESALNMNIPLEINLLGISSKRNYPDRRFWKIAGEVGCLTVLGCDAHSPDSLADRSAEITAINIAEEFRLNLVSPENILC